MSLAVAQRIRLQLSQRASYIDLESAVGPSVFYSKRRFGLIREFADVDSKGEFHSVEMHGDRQFWVTGSVRLVCQLAIPRHVRWVCAEIACGKILRDIEITINERSTARYRFRSKRRLRIALPESTPIQRCSIEIKVSPPLEPYSSVDEPSVKQGVLIKEICFAKTWWRTIFLKLGRKPTKR